MRFDPKQFGSGILGGTLSFAVTIAAAPAAGGVTVGRRSIAGADRLAIRAAQMLERLAGPDLSRVQFFKAEGTAATTLAFTGCVTANFSAAGTATTRTPAATSYATRAKRSAYVSAATAGSLASWYMNTTPVFVGNGSGLGGLFAVFRFVVSDPATVSGARMFVGLSATTGAPTNVEPSGLTNQIGVAQISSSSNLQIVYGGGTAQTAIDLGANFPANTLSADLYELILFSDPNDSGKIGYEVNRNGGDYVTGGFSARGSITNTTPGTTLPSTGTALAPRFWRTNKATALAVGLEIVSVTVTWDY